MKRIEEIQNRLSRVTSYPWKWEREDASVFALYGPRGSEDHVLWSQVCDACQKYGNRCTAPSDADMAFIETAPSDVDYLLAEIAKLKIKLQKAALNQARGR